MGMVTGNGRTWRVGLAGPVVAGTLGLLGCPAHPAAAGDASSAALDAGPAAVAPPAPAPVQVWWVWDGGSALVGAQDEARPAPVTLRAWLPGEVPGSIRAPAVLVASGVSVASAFSAAAADGGAVASVTLEDAYASGPVTVSWLRETPLDGGTATLLLATTTIPLQATAQPEPAAPQPKKKPAKSKAKKRRH